MRATASNQDSPGNEKAASNDRRPALRHACAFPVAILAALALCLFWSFWPTFVDMEQRWSHDPQYSHGFLVPVFAAVVLWFRRDSFPAGRLRPNWGGVVFLTLALLMRLSAAYLHFKPLDAYALLPALAGLCLLLAGWPILRWCWPAIAFLGFMLPLPFQVDQALAQPLRGLATAASTYGLQTLGLPALSEGNIILIDDLRLGVVEACSGLGMLVTFFALATAVALICDRPLLDRLLIVVSAVPIALLANVGRITATALAYCLLSKEVGDLIMHDLAGWLMMPVALAMVWLELRLLSRLLIEVEEPRPVPLDLASVRAAGPYVRKASEPLACDLHIPHPAAAPRRAAHDVPPPSVPNGR